jgi:hypothetical protein
MCAGPGGTPLPAGGVLLDASQTGAAATNTCGMPGGALRAALTGTTKWDGSQGASLRFAAPAGATIGSASVTRSAVGVTGPTPDGGSFLYRLRTNAGVLETCAACDATPKTFAQAGLQAAYVEAGVSCVAAQPDTCTAPADPNTDPRVDITQTTFTVVDNTPPTLSNIRGALFSSAPAKGIITVQFNAADSGGGLYRAFTLVDDKVVATQPLDQHCTDVNTGDTNPYEFSSLQPCLQTLTDFTVPIDTTKLSEGVHTFAVQIEDAAGNKVSVAGPKAIRVENLNGVHASRRARISMWFVSNHKRQASTLRGQRVVIRGVLRNRKGRGISGAIVDVYHYVSGHRLSKTGLKSRRGGRLTLILPKNVFGDKHGLRTLLFVYRVKRPGPATSKQHLLLTIRYPDGKPVYRPLFKKKGT